MPSTKSTRSAPSGICRYFQFPENTSALMLKLSSTVGEVMLRGFDTDGWDTGQRRVLEGKGVRAARPTPHGGAIGSTPWRGSAMSGATRIIPEHAAGGRR